MTSVAPRYAQGLFLAAEQAKAVASVADVARVLQASLSEVATAESFLGNPLVASAEKLSVLNAALAKTKADKKVTTLFVNLFSTLEENQRLSSLQDVLKAFKDLVNAAQGCVSAQVVSAEKLSAAQLKDVEKRALEYAKKDDKTAKSIDLTQTQDSNVIAGFRLRVGSTELDTTAAGRVERLKQSLSI